MSPIGQKLWEEIHFEVGKCAQISVVWFSPVCTFKVFRQCALLGFFSSVHFQGFSLVCTFKIKINKVKVKIRKVNKGLCGAEIHIMPPGLLDLCSTEAFIVEISVCWISALQRPLLLRFPSVCLSVCVSVLRPSGAQTVWRNLMKLGRQVYDRTLQGRFSSFVDDVIRCLATDEKLLFSPTRPQK